MRIIRECISKTVHFHRLLSPLFHPSLLGVCLTVFVAMLASRPGAQTTGGAVALGTVEGYIRCEDTGAPARLAIVNLIPLAEYLKKDDKLDYSSEKEEGTYTDFDGYYFFSSVHPGRYVLDVDLAGYSRDQQLVVGNVKNFALTSQRELLTAFPQVTVKSGAGSRLDAAINRGGVITGRITFDSGGPLIGANVMATMVSTNLLDQCNQSHSDAATLSHCYYAVMAVSDDRGVYRFAGLPQGKYRISVRLIETSVMPGMKIKRVGDSDLTVFAPEALTEATAQVIEVNHGDEITGADISIPLRMLYSIGGVVTLRGEPLQGANVYIYSKQEDWNPGDFPFSTTTLADGSYRIDLMPAGTYFIRAEFVHNGKRLPSAVREIPVTVLDGSVDGVNIDLNLQQK